MLVEIESPAEWEARNTQEGPPVVDPQSGNKLYPNGAFVVGSGARCEAPADEYAALQISRRYWYVRLVKEENAFMSFRAQQIDQANFAGAVPTLSAEIAVAELKKGRQRVFALRKKLAAIDAAISETPQEVTRRERDRVIRERQQKAKEAIAAIQAVNLDGDESED